MYSRWEPQLQVRWQGGWRDRMEKLWVLRAFLPVLPDGVGVPAFRDAQVVPRRPPRQVLVLSMAAHVLFLVLPLPEFLTRPPQPAESFREIRIEQLAWTGTSRVLPPITPSPRRAQRPQPGGQERQPLPPRGADAVARQAIVSNPPNPNHPTQTLLQQFGLERARVRAPEVKLPNMVIPPSAEATPTPLIDLQRARLPNTPLDRSGPPAAPAPPVPKKRAELAIENTQLKNVVPRLTLPTSTGGSAEKDAPDVNAAATGAARSGDLAVPGVIALSPNPAVPAPVLRLPEGNLRARFAVGPASGPGSPGGVPGGVPGGQGGSGGGPGGTGGGAGGGLNAPDIFVAPAGPVPAGPVIVGPGERAGNVPPPPSPPKASTSGPGQGEVKQAAPAKPPKQRGRELLEALRSGAPGLREIETTYAYIANLTSQSSTWKVHYAAQPRSSNGVNGNGAAKNAAMTPPQVKKKVDPCYPSDSYRERVDGTVVLYAVIGADGRVLDATLVEGVHPQVDARAVKSLQQSQFEPARQNGQTVPVEVLVEIPFRLALCL